MRVGIVIPTLGTRSEYLQESIRSIRAAGQAHICLVVPIESDVDALLNGEEVDQIVADPMLGLAAAIDLGLKSLPSEIEFVNWLGDDDRLAEDCLKVCTESLETNSKVVLVFGSCDYIDDVGRKIWRNRSGSWAVPLLRFGPCMVPQPGALFRRSAYEAIGGLDSKYSWAFDFDLFIRLSKYGKVKFINRTVSQFRWHTNSLTVGQRSGSVNEASVVRRSHLPKALRGLSFIWEIPVRHATLRAGTKVSERGHAAIVKLP